MGTCTFRCPLRHKTWTVAFLVMINDIKFATANKWKYVDHTCIAETVQKGNCSTIQSNAELVQNWSRENRLELNADKCKEMIINLNKQKNSFDQVSIERKGLDIVSHAKTLGMTMSNNLLWNDHINEVIRKSNKHLYFIVLLKLARALDNARITSKGWARYSSYHTQPMLLMSAREGGTYISLSIQQNISR